MILSLSLYIFYAVYPFQPKTKTNITNKCKRKKEKIKEKSTVYTRFFQFNLPALISIFWEVSALLFRITRLYKYSFLFVSLFVGRHFCVSFFSSFFLKNMCFLHLFNFPCIYYPFFSLFLVSFTNFLWYFYVYPHTCPYIFYTHFSRDMLILTFFFWIIFGQKAMDKWKWKWTFHSLT